MTLPDDNPLRRLAALIDRLERAAKMGKKANECGPQREGGKALPGTVEANATGGMDQERREQAVVSAAVARTPPARDASNEG